MPSDEHLSPPRPRPGDAPGHRHEPWEELGAALVVDEPGVKCWIETVPPGEARPLHTHRHPWVTVVLSGAHGESLDEHGGVIKKVALETGQVLFNDGAQLPMRHRVRNLSDRTLVMVAIERRADGGGVSEAAA
ncbi:cupin domain-containing protein [Streptomyces avicenniae]|uniref:cupin domain-containing protein n=1 Tax=Streptomyces avicenniae TaxID=500153 RepID=UPI00069B4A0A|nr:cupin domain-containing protein [Streptomyces avicenniae]